MSPSTASRAMPVWLWPWCLFLFLLPFDQVILGLKLGELHLLLGLGSATLLAFRPSRPRPAGAQSLAVALLVLVLAASYFVSLDPAKTSKYLTLVMCHWLIYALATLSAMRLDQVERSLRAWAWGGAVAAALTILGSFAGLEGAPGAEERPTLVIGHATADPNFLAAGLLLPFALGLRYLLSRERRWQGLVITGLTGWAILLTQSRGGSLAMLAVAVATLVGDRRWKGLVALIGGLALLLLQGTILGRFNLLADDPSGAGRTEVWNVLLSAGIEHWATGIGLGASTMVTAAIPPLYFPLEPHNMFVEAFTEAGLFGLLMVVLVWAFHFRGDRSHPLVRTVQASMTGVMVAGIFLHLLPFKLVWMIWAVAAQATFARSLECKPTLTARRPGAHPSLNEGVEPHEDDQAIDLPRSARGGGVHALPPGRMGRS